MIRVYQTLTTANDGRGNCFIACVASIVERPLRELPDIASDLNGGEFFQRLEDWLIPQGLFINRRIQPPVGWSIAGGFLRHREVEVPHAVIAFNGLPVHDPYPLFGEFRSNFEFYSIDPISDAQRPYCAERLLLCEETNP